MLLNLLNFAKINRWRKHFDKTKWGGRESGPEALGREEGVRGLREGGAHARDGAEEIASRPQVRDGPPHRCLLSSPPFVRS